MSLRLLFEYIRPVIALLYLLSGFILAGLGGEAFVRGSVGLSLSLRIPTAIIGVTVAAFATSSPELSVAINAALLGRPQISLGDALGSNVVNISLVLGLTLCFGGLPVRRMEIRRDWSIALLAPLLIGLFAYDGEISRIDGIILLVLFFLWLTLVIVEIRKSRKNLPVQNGDMDLIKSILYCLAGIGLLVAAGLSIVMGAKAIGVMFGIPTFIVGATLVALGTSIPELATTIISRMRGHTEMGLGTLLGSNIFNVFVIVAITAIIHPIHVMLKSLLVVLVICLVTTVLTWPTKLGILPRSRGWLCILIYVLYLLLVFRAGT